MSHVPEFLVETDYFLDFAFIFRVGRIARMLAEPPTQNFGFKIFHSKLFSIFQGNSMSLDHVSARWLNVNSVSIYDTQQCSIDSLFFSDPKESIGSFSPEENDLLYEKLKLVVDEHENLIDLCRRLSRSLSTNVLIHYITSAIITCICCLMILLAEGFQKIIFINYIIASTCQVFLYSIGGNLLADSSAKIQESAYNFQWYRCDNRIRKLIQIMMIRAQKKTAVDVPFFQTSLETFGSVSNFCDFMTRLL